MKSRIPAAARLLAALSLLALAPTALAAQATGTVSGRVVDAAAMNPLPGVQVAIEGTTRGATTGADGRFEITGVPAGEISLRATLLGYSAGVQRTTVVAGQTANVTLQLAIQVLVLDELVVTGTAGRQERRAQGATVASIPVSSVMETAPVSNVSEVLQGRVPGVSLTQGSGVSGTAQQIRIRGAASISLSNEPLIYIDGVRVDSRQVGVAAGAVTSALNNINPEDIESIEIVKGPAAATLYGADASAGVIQIITKKGAQSGSFEQRLSMGYDRLTAGFTPLRNFGACRAQDIAGSSTLCQGRQVGDIVSDSPMERYGLPQDGMMRTFNWSGRGGGNGYGIFASAGYTDEEGLFPNNQYRRMTGRLNYTLTPSGKLSFGFNFPVTLTDADFPVTAGSSRGWTIGGFGGSPLTVGTPTDGWFASNRTPEAIASIENSYSSLWLTPDVSLQYQPTDRLVNRVNLGVDVTRTRSFEFFPRNDLGWYSAQENRGQITESRRTLDRVTFKYLGTYQLPLTTAWSSSLSFGTEVLSEQEDLSFAFGNGLTTNAARSVSAAAQVSGGQELFRDRRVGVFGQWEPNFREQLYLQFGLRADKFAAFGSDADWFMSPSARLSWVVSDAPFWNLPSAGFSTLRLRAAYGVTGRAPTAGASLRTYQASPFVLGPSQVGSGVVPLNPGNPGLRAERGAEFEGGLDAAFLNGRATLELTYFDKQTRDLLLRVPQPPSLGFQEDPFENIGKVVNRGIEVAATGRIVTRDNVDWELRGAVNTLHNEVVDLGGVSPFSSIRFGPVNRIVEGRQVGAYHSQRILRIDAASGRAIVADSMEFMGNLLPTFEGNLSSTLTLFRNLRLYAHADWKQNYSLYNATALYRERNQGVAENWVRRMEVLSDEERIRRFGPYFTESGESVPAGNVLDAYIEPADFVRLNEVSLSYRLPSGFGQRFRASSVAVTLAGRNLAMWTDYSGFNPDVQNEFDAVAGRADFYTFPPPRRWALSVDLEF